MPVSADAADPAPTRVVLAEDGVLFREGSASCCAGTGSRSSRPWGTPTTWWPRCTGTAPRLVVTDIRMPPTHTDEGIRAALALRAADARLPVLVLSHYVDDGDAAALLEGGDGSHLAYLLKDRVVDVDDFAGTLHRVVAGASVVDPAVVRRLLRRSEPIDRLTPREREVLGLVAGAAPTPRSPRTWSCPRPRWSSTSAASSASWTCRRTTTSTAACSPCSPTCGHGRRTRPRHSPRGPPSPPLP